MARLECITTHQIIENKWFMNFNNNIPIAESYKDAFLLFKTDVYRLYGGAFLCARCPR